MGSREIAVIKILRTKYDKKRRPIALRDKKGNLVCISDSSVSWQSWAFENLLQHECWIHGCWTPELISWGRHVFVGTVSPQGTNTSVYRVARWSQWKTSPFVWPRWHTNVVGIQLSYYYRSSACRLHLPKWLRISDMTYDIHEERTQHTKAWRTLFRCYHKPSYDIQSTRRTLVKYCLSTFDKYPAASFSWHVSNAVVRHCEKPGLKRRFYVAIISRKSMRNAIDSKHSKNTEVHVDLVLQHLARCVFRTLSS